MPREEGSYSAFTSTRAYVLTVCSSNVLETKVAAPAAFRTGLNVIIPRLVEVTTALREDDYIPGLRALGRTVRIQGRRLQGLEILRRLISLRLRLQHR